VVRRDRDAKKEAGQVGPAGHTVEVARDRFLISALLTAPVVFWSDNVQNGLGYAAPRFAGSNFIPAVLGTIVFVVGWLVLVRGAVGELRLRMPGLMA
jgi:Cu2+-exporting ATPase